MKHPKVVEFDACDGNIIIYRFQMKTRIHNIISEIEKTNKEYQLLQVGAS